MSCLFLRAGTANLEAVIQRSPCSCHQEINLHTHIIPCPSIDTGVWKKPGAPLAMCRRQEISACLYLMYVHSCSRLSCMRSALCVLWRSTFEICTGCELSHLFVSSLFQRMICNQLCIFGADGRHVCMPRIYQLNFVWAKSTGELPEGIYKHVYLDIPCLDITHVVCMSHFMSRPLSHNTPGKVTSRPSNEQSHPECYNRKSYGLRTLLL